MATLKCPKCGSQVSVSAGGSAICPGCNSKLRLKDTSTGQAGPTSRASAEPAAEWYYADARNERIGPVTPARMVELVRAGDVSENSLVWRDGMSDWTALSRTELVRLLPEAAGSGRSVQRGARGAVPDETPAHEAHPRAAREMEAVPLDASKTTKKTPFGIVWVAVHSALSSLLYLGYGLIIVVRTLIASPLRELGESLGARYWDSQEMTVLMLLELLGAVLIHLGILHLVCTYGLLMRQRWGLTLARGLYVISGVLALVALIVSIGSRSGIISAFVGVLTVAVVLTYLHGGSGVMQSFRERLRVAAAGRGLDEDSWR